MHVATAPHLFAYRVRAHNKQCARLVRCLRQARCCHKVMMRAIHIVRRHDAGSKSTCNPLNGASAGRERVPARCLERAAAAFEHDSLWPRISSVEVHDIWLPATDKGGISCHSRIVTHVASVEISGAARGPQLLELEHDTAGAMMRTNGCNLPTINEADAI